MIDFESQSAHTLIALAGRQGGSESALCQLAFARLGAAERLRGNLHSALARHQLSDLQFAMLVLLFEAEPKPIPMAVLANHAGVSRAAVTNALDSLEISGLAIRTRDLCDRRVIPVALTEAGRKRIEPAIGDYLKVATDGARSIEKLERYLLSARREHVGAGLNRESKCVTPIIRSLARI